MVSENCGQCGAPKDDAGIICEFCGHQQKQIVSMLDELTALRELNVAAQSLAKEGRDVGDFWLHAFIPSHAEPIESAFHEAIGRLVECDFEDIDEKKLNRSMLARARSLASAYRNCVDRDAALAPKEVKMRAALSEAAAKFEPRGLRWLIKHPGFQIFACILVLGGAALAAILRSAVMTHWAEVKACRDARPYDNKLDETDRVACEVACKAGHDESCRNLQRVDEAAMREKRLQRTVLVESVGVGITPLESKPVAFKCGPEEEDEFMQSVEVSISVKNTTIVDQDVLLVAANGDGAELTRDDKGPVKAGASRVLEFGLYMKNKACRSIEKFVVSVKD